MELYSNNRTYSGYDSLPSGAASFDLTQGCLVLEGGAWRGIYTQGALDALMENGINFQTTIGISAGAMSGIGYVSGQIGWAPRINLRFRRDPNYCGLGAFRRDHGITGFSYLFEDLMRKYPINRERFDNPDRRFIVGATDLEKGRVEYFEKGKCEDIFKAVQASATVPYISQPVYIDGVPYLDGGLITKIPYHWAKAREFKKIMVIRTRDRSYRKEPDNVKKNFHRNRVFFRNYLDLQLAMLHTCDRYNKLLDEIDADEAEGKIFVLAPKEPVRISRFESDMEKLGNLYQAGYHEMKEQIPALQKYLAG